MNHLTIIFFALAGGVFLSIQGGLNAQLGILLKNPMLATLVAYLFSTVFAFVFALFSLKSVPTIHQVKEIPYYLWFSGALFSVIGISLYYYTIPKLGISSMISIGLFGQILFSSIAGHFAWFGLPPEPIDLRRLAGISALVIGVFLLNKK
ncbi:EamA-like transporter family protein [Maribellus comscasis]|uniref:EamA-like transporter family protein n=1 Tax=Maribellus comscasis TaxID=2681766 RepID=A0A6I6JTC5_9BACT|nr:DMT family transporter [Maribellus comscasis]QGY45721.1 EamA-like transporter family protein [Maribellus comscasis]